MAADLDGLALALGQAGAFIVKHRGTLAAYRTRWQEQEKKVLEWFHEPTMNYPKSVATIWQTSIEELSEHGPLLANCLLENALVAFSNLASLRA
ncbi:hypothetical protein [Blastopirellula retiformator]|uniref:hypothetical protein n=1 Tax=Blastopirellula retiformator TaxID=2527970 RepID=UPI0011B502B6|nr:hypothetical protein [Blastopirellula retiformator]